MTGRGKRKRSSKLFLIPPAPSPGRTKRPCVRSLPQRRTEREREKTRAVPAGPCERTSGRHRTRVHGSNERVALLASRGGAGAGKEQSLESDGLAAASQVTCPSPTPAEARAHALRRALESGRMRRGGPPPPPPQRIPSHPTQMDGRTRARTGGVNGIQIPPAQVRSRGARQPPDGRSDGLPRNGTREGSKNVTPTRGRQAALASNNRHRARHAMCRPRALAARPPRRDWGAEPSGRVATHSRRAQPPPPVHQPAATLTRGPDAQGQRVKPPSPRRTYPFQRGRESQRRENRRRPAGQAATASEPRPPTKGKKVRGAKGGERGGPTGGRAPL